MDQQDAKASLDRVVDFQHDTLLFHIIKDTLLPSMIVYYPVSAYDTGYRWGDYMLP